MMMKSKRLIEKSMDLHVDESSADHGTVQHRIMTMVSEGGYDPAIKIVKEYQEKKKFYPGFAVKTDRLFKHSLELIEAIKAKKNFPNISGLTHNKQEELAQKINEHWEELKISLRRVRTIERDLELEDAKSTLLVVRAIVLAGMLVIVTYVIREAILSLGIPVKVAADDIINIFWGLF